MGLTPADLCFHSSFLPNSLLLYIILNKSCFLFHLRIQSFCLHACIKNSPLDPIRHVLMSHFFRIIPVMNHSVVIVLLAVRLTTSGATHSHGVTGGVYKARERIHRDILIHDY